MKSAKFSLRKAIESVYAWLIIHLILAGILAKIIHFLTEPGLLRRITVIITMLSVMILFLFICWLWYILRKWPHEYDGRDWQFLKDEWQGAKDKSII